MVIILDKHVVWCYNFIIEGHIHVFIVVWNLIWFLWSQHKVFSIPQNFRVGSGRNFFNFGLMLNCFGPVWSGENIIGSVRGQGHKIYYFSVRSGSGQKITGQYRFGVPKTLPRRTLVHSMYVVCMCMYVVFCKIDHCIHILWCIVMGLGHNDPWVESHMWPKQTWGQRSSRGQWPLVQVFGKWVSVSTYFDVFSNLILQWLQKYVIAKAGETRGSRTALLNVWDS